MKKLAVIIAYCLLFTAYCFTQDFTPPKPAEPAKGKTPFWSWDRVYGGGGLGLQFGNFTLVNIAPDIGYKITEKYSAGIGLRYIYIGDRRVVPAYELNIYGASVFNRYLLTDFLFAHAEYEVLNGPWGYYSSQRSFLTNIWVGSGLRQHAGNSSINVTALWNLNNTPNNPFPNPQIRIGIGIGI